MINKYIKLSIEKTEKTILGISGIVGIACLAALAYFPKYQHDQLLNFNPEVARIDSIYESKKDSMIKSHQLQYDSLVHSHYRQIDSLEKIMELNKK
jgi:hypothetical protein